MITRIITALPTGSPSSIRVDLEELQAWVLNQESRGAVVDRLTENTAQLAAAAEALRNVAAVVERIERTEAERGILLAPVIKAVSSRMSWVAWLQTPGRGRELAYIVILLVAVLSRPDLIPAVVATFVGGSTP